jgi:hypothetical protein
MKKLIFTVTFALAATWFFGQHTLYNKDKQVTKEGVFKDNKFYEGRSYFYDNSGNLLLVQFYKNGAAVRDSIVTEKTKKEVAYNKPVNLKDTTRIIELSVDPKGMLRWKTRNEHNKLPFIIEQFRWNKWIKIGEIEAKGSQTENQYSFNFFPHHGENQFRVTQVNENYASQTVKKNF